MKDMNEMLLRAIEISMNAHKEQKDKSGEPYILHCLRVMLKGKTKEEQIAGVLHDVVEDSEITIEELKKEGFPDVVLDAVNCLTKWEGMDYDVYVEGVLGNELSKRVKLYDLEDNMNIGRLKEVKVSDVERLNKYLRTYERIRNS